MGTTLHTTEPECLVLSAAQVAKLLGISVRHLWACHSSGKLGPPAHLAGAFQALAA